MSVDLPMPGSPVKIINAPGKIPPPITRSHSRIPEHIRAWCSSVMSSRGASERATDFLWGEATGELLCSVKLFHSLHSGHEPCHFGVMQPQRAHINCCFILLI